MAAPVIPTQQVFDYEMAAGDPVNTNPLPLVGITVTVQLDATVVNTISPQANIEPARITATTDTTGKWSVNLIPNSNISPANTTYTVTTPTKQYQIIVPSSSGPFQSTSIAVTSGGSLSPVSIIVPGPLTVQGLLTASGGESVSGGLTVAGGTTVSGGLTVSSGTVSLPAGSLSVAALTGVLPIANGGTGSATQNFVDLTTVQSVGGAKTFSAALTASLGLTVSAGGATVTAGGLTVSAGGSAITGASTVTGTLTSTAEVAGTDFKATGLTGAANQTRLVGRTSSGAPSSGTFSTGDHIVDGNGMLWVNTAGGTPGTWVPSGPIKLADLSPTSGTSQSVSIPSGITGLQLKLKIKNGSTADVGIRFNADTGSNYFWNEAAGNGTTMTVQNNNTAYIRVGAINSATFETQHTVNVNDITGSAHKTLDATSARIDAAAGSSIFSILTGGLWNSTSAITSVQVIVSAGSFASGTSIRIYGYA